jgi:hypothetical protein
MAARTDIPATRFFSFSIGNAHAELLNSFICRVEPNDIKIHSKAEAS